MELKQPSNGGKKILMKKLSNQKINKKENEIIELLDELKIPFSGTVIYCGQKKYHISPFQQISISGIGPIFYLNKKDQKIYTLLQRRFKDNFQWWFPGGYVELPSATADFFSKNFQKIKEATIKEFYKNSLEAQDWQKARKEINDPKKLEKIFKKQGIKWPKEIDANWQSAWQREVFEETGVDLDKFPQALILNLKMSQTLMLGAESDRLVNIDGKFCAFLGELEKAPESTPDHEVEELKWIATDEIIFDKKQKKYLAANFCVNPYVLSLLEESLFEFLCHKIKQISKIKNPLTKQEISRFNTVQNLQSFLIEKSSNFKIKKLEFIKEFLSWKFGECEIGKNLCGKNGNKLYKTTLEICKFISSQNLESPSDFKNLNNLIEQNHDILYK
jgi:8-oxo-dGTP pyrophosphatase MutT (NUDIX family)